MYKTNQELDFIIHDFEADDRKEYQLSIMSENGELQFYNFLRTTPASTVSDKPNVTKLFGRESEDTRSKDWLQFQGVTNSESEADSGIYKIFDSGKCKVIEQNSKFKEVVFNGEIITGKWYLRQMPNIFHKSLFGEVKNITLFWKPPEQESYNGEQSTVKCACPVEDASSKYLEITKQEGIETTVKLSHLVDFNLDSHEFEGIAAAAGPIIDLFGVTYTYTPDFIETLFNEQQSKLSNGGQILLNTEHPNDPNEVDGRVTEVQLFHEPIKHIRVKGIYNGPTFLSEGDIGLSYEFRFRSVWNEDFQSWIPFNAITDKLSVVRRPACKICWITKVN